MSFVVVGASSFIGGVVTSHLVKEGETVVPVYRRDLPDAPDWWVEIPGKIQGDIREERVQQAITSANPQALIYLVSLNHKESETLMTEVVPVNFLPVWRILESMKNAGWRGRFVYMSTQQVYGKGLTGVVKEDEPEFPQNYYGLTHCLAENVCRYFKRAHDMDSTVVRLANSYGVPVFSSNDCWSIVVNQLVKMAVDHGVLELKSDGSPMRDFLHVQDVARFIRDVARSHRPMPTTMNLGSGTAYSIYELARLIREEYASRTNAECPIVQENKGLIEDAPQIDDRLIYVSSRAREIGFVPRIDLRTGIAELFNHLERAVH